MARPKNDIERVQTGIRLQPDLLKALKHLSVDLNRPLNVLVEEAIEDLLTKYGKVVGEGEKVGGADE